jgi:hypothetical protein
MSGDVAVIRVRVWVWVGGWVGMEVFYAILICFIDIHLVIFFQSRQNVISDFVIVLKDVFF